MAAIMIPLAKLIVFDLIVLIVFLTLLIPLKRFKGASYAVLQRDFVGYFTNPTGYVFICVFVLLCSLAAFAPQAFFNDNLANLNQLNRWFPLIMLIFIPAITMSVWADERREGTDELLLTIPASDVDIVLGKYLAVVSIFSVVLFFSQFWNFVLLNELSHGDVDVGLFIATYVGYWFVGIAMLGLGMAASFLTSNLTVSFILGALFNAPLMMFYYADRLVAGQGAAESLAFWSYISRFSDFGRGVISFAACAFFVLVAVFGVYLSVVFIGRRHWQGGRDGHSLLPHFIVRASALVLIVFAASRFLSDHDRIRFDATEGKVCSLSADTRKLLRELDTKRPVVIEAYISSSLPEQFAQTKLDLINMLREVESLAGANVEIRLHDNMDTFTDEAALAEEQYGITPVTVMTRSRGTIKEEPVFLSAGLACGLNRVVIPLFSRGVPVEYELVRSIVTVADATRMKIGIVKTSVNMFGGVNMSTFQRNPKQLIVEELEKQYEVEEIDPSQPIPEGVYDCVMVVQPSSLNPVGLNHLIAAIQNGVPVAIFEDPYPSMMPGAPPTSQPRPPQGGPMAMMGGGGPSEPKADIRQLWDVLGVEMVGQPASRPGLYDAHIISQQYNPYEGQANLDSITPEWVFISPLAPGAGSDAFNPDDIISSELSQILFMYPGALKDLGTRKLEFTPLVHTGDLTSEIGFEALQAGQDMLRQGNAASLRFARKRTDKRYIIGARIRGQAGALNQSDAMSPLLAQTVPTDAADVTDSADVTDAAETSGSQDALFGVPDVGPAANKDNRNREIHVVYIGDVDLLSSAFMELRSQAFDGEVDWDFDNVTFVLNILDSLAGDDRLIDIRKRKVRHSTLQEMTEQKDLAKKASFDQIKEFNEEFETARDEAQAKMDKVADESRETIQELTLRARTDGGAARSELEAAIMKREIDREREAIRFARTLERLELDRERKLKLIDRNREMSLRKIQNGYKLRAALMPPLPPLLIGLLVWVYRRRREQGGVVESRRR